LCVLGWAGAGAVRAYSDEASFFAGLGDLPGGIRWSEVLAVSSDGATVVGSSEAAAGLEAYKWTDPADSGEGMVSVGDLPGLGRGRPTLDRRLGSAGSGG
jgi:hypothetical protein